MNEHYNQVLNHMEETLRIFEARVSYPNLTKTNTGFVVRYKEKDIYQALVQKLARVISGLHAARLLLDRGFVQELGALQRMLDESNEDISFLACGIIYNQIGDLHKRYLEYFYQEEFDTSGRPLSLSEGRPTIPRKKIRAFLAKIMAPDIPESMRIESSKTLSKVYSGFIHGASPQIMDMCVGDPPMFMVRGMLGTPRIEEHADDLWNYFYRGILSFAAVAKAFGDDNLFASIRQYRDHFEAVSGKTFKPFPGPGAP
jgi:hypothetical protein